MTVFVLPWNRKMLSLQHSELINLAPYDLFCMAGILDVAMGLNRNTRLQAGLAVSICSRF